MIIVRKPDGTKVKMTLADFRASKQKTNNPSVSPSGLSATSKVSPAHQKNNSTQSEKAWDKDDHVSLMDNIGHREDLMPLQVNRRAVSTQGDRARQQSQKSEPTSQGVTRASSHGLSQAQKDVPPKNVINARSVKPVPEELSRLIESARERPIIQDIRANERFAGRTVKKSMGPVDEIGTMTLADIRRLGSTAEMVQAAMVQKFETLKKDAFITYLDAVHAWEMSPLYKGYVSVLEQALKNRQSVVEYTEAHKSEQELTAEDVSIIYGVSAHVRL